MINRPERRTNAVAKRLGLLGLIATVLVALLGVFASSASASALLRPETRVAAIEHSAGQFVGPHSSVLAVQGRDRAPSYDQRAAGSSVAAEGGVIDLPAATTWGRAETLAGHFASHGADFGATSAEEYAQQAPQFFQRGIEEGLPIRIAPKSGVIRIYDPESNMFGAYNANGTTRTFYAPDPAIHGYPTNWDYWLSQAGSGPWTP